MYTITGSWIKSSYSSSGGGNTCVEAAPAWRKSSRSNGANGSCVETAGGNSGCCVAVRDSKDPAGGNLMFGRGDWAAFLGAVT